MGVVDRHLPVNAAWCVVNVNGLGCNLFSKRFQLTDPTRSDILARQRRKTLGQKRLRKTGYEVIVS